MTTEQDFLARVAEKLGRSPESAPPPFRPSEPLPAIGPRGKDALADRFQMELEKINGVVHRVNDASEVAPTIVRILNEAPAADPGKSRTGDQEGAGTVGRTVVRWADPLLDEFDIDRALEQAGWQPVAFRQGDDGRAFVARVEQAHAGIVGCDAAIAETGTIVLGSSPLGGAEGNGRGSGDARGNGSAGGRGRTVSLLPPVLIALLRKEQIVFDSAQLFRRLARAPMPSQVIFKSGPSRSSDIENDLTIGVHGPGALHVILL